MDAHVRILAILHIALGVFGLLMGAAVLVIFGGLAGWIGLKGAHLSPNTLVAVPILSLVGGAICLLLVVLSLPGLIAGFGLLRFRPWARVLTIVLSAIELLNVPLGTALGVYGLWVLLSPAAEPLFQPHPAARG